MPNAIITTTINSPTEALYKFSSLSDWDLIIIGDLKTPHKEYETSNKWIYIHPEEQEKNYPLLSSLIGWNCIQRRNIGLLYAYKNNYDIIATIDDDNIPYENWGQNCSVNKTINIDIYNTNQEVFDPLFATNRPEIWHRGFPLELVKKREIDSKTIEQRKILVQADLWDGEADVDALERLSLNTNGKFNTLSFYGSNKISPFNSQNTFLSKEIIPDYFLFPHIGRLDDIWASYYIQSLHGLCVAYAPSSVFQERNIHTIVKDMTNEFIGYQHTFSFIKSLPNNFASFLPEKSLKAFQEYQNIIKG